jgi:hypothetical protein
MPTRKNTKKYLRKTRRSKRQKGSGPACSKLRGCNADQNNIEEEDPNTKDDYLRQAILEEDPRWVKMYLEEGANPNITILGDHEYLPASELVPAIIYAARYIKSPAIMKLLVKNGVSIEQKYNTATPLIEAAEWGNLSAVRFLLNEGANINATIGSGVTALGYAVLNEDIPMIKLMLDKRKGEIKLNYTAFGDPENVIDEAVEYATNPEVARILKNYVIGRHLPVHSERQKKRLQLGFVMDKKKMPTDLTHKIMTEHFGGKSKRKTRRK